MSRPVALITGATRGIGAAIAAELADSHDLLIGGRDPQRTAEKAAGFRSARPFVADLDDDAAVVRAVAGIERLDVLVHSAGVVSYGAVEQTPSEEWQRVLATNVIAPARLTRLLLPALRSAHGLVVFINSGAGLRANPGFAVYAASKFALTGLADALRAEEHGRVRVTSVHPGRVATDMQVELRALEGGDYRPERYLKPAQIAKAVRVAVELPASASVDTVQLNPA